MAITIRRSGTISFENSEKKKKFHTNITGISRPSIVTLTNRISRRYSTSTMVTAVWITRAIGNIAFATLDNLNFQ
jgi:hypothetical protein